MAYKELRSAYSLTLTTGGVVGAKAYITSPADDCTIDDIPTIGEPFSVAYPTCKLRSIRAVPYNVETTTGTTQFKYLCSYDTKPDVTWVDDNYFGDTYTGGSTAVSIDLKNEGGDWYWLEEFDDAPNVSDRIKKRQTYVVEAKGTYSKIISLAQTQLEGATYKDWGTFLTDNIFKCIGKCNYEPVPVSSTPDEPKTFKIGQLLFTSFDCKSGISESGIHIWTVNLNFAYRSLDVGGVADVEYPWLYLLNDQKKAGSNAYQIPIKDKDSLSVADPRDENGIYLYDHIDFNTELSPLI